MRTVAQVLSLLYIVSLSCGFVHDTHTTTRIRHPRAAYLRQWAARQYANDDNNKLVGYRPPSSSSAIFTCNAISQVDSSYFDDNKNTQQHSDVDLNNPPATIAITPIESNAASSYVLKTRRKPRATAGDDRRRHTEISSTPNSKQVLSGTMTKSMQVASVERKPLRYSKVSEKQWNVRFQELVEYKQTHGDCSVPRQFVENPQLGTWVNYQRSLYKCEPKTISDERIQRLNDIGFDWDPFQAQWESRFKELWEYKRQHGDCLVPLQFQDNPQLGQWVNAQRSSYHGLPKSISDERVQRLNSIGFEWDALQAQWELHFKELLHYKQQHGDCLVPQCFHDNPQLGKWVGKQRTNYNRLPKKISEERIQRLNDIGFEWDPFQAQWESRFRELLDYKQQHGDCLVTRQFQDNPQLGLWVTTQRKKNSCLPKTISDERIERLNKIGFEWDALQAQWELHFKELLHYKQQHGDCLVPRRFHDNPQLGDWVATQRMSYNSDTKTMSNGRIARLNDVGFEWDPLQARWESRFKELLEYKQQHGDCLVPHHFQDNKQLGLWVRTQRRSYNCLPQTISGEHQSQRLEAVGFEWDVFKAQWESRFRELVKYKQQYGNCWVPQKFEEIPGLGNWVRTQRQNYKQVPRKISDEYVRRLDDIGFAWVGRNMQGEEGEYFKFC